MKKSTAFKMGDVVWSQHFGCGHVTSTNIGTGTPYVIEVTWEGAVPHCDYFTYDGQYDLDDPDPGCDIHPITDAKPLEYDKEKEKSAEEQKTESITFGTWLNRAKNYALMQLEKRRANSKEKEREEMKKNIKFNVGDRVVSRAFGTGVVTEIVALDHTYPVVVKWDDDAVHGGTFSAFTLRGWYYNHRSDTEKDIELSETGLTNVEYSPINPSHYQVKGIPEAIDIMKHLMTQEQFKGFLWGNIIKYAYRYGRKGDEHDTAGKIEWYANRLKEVCAEEKKEQE